MTDLQRLLPVAIYPTFNEWRYVVSRCYEEIPTNA